MAKETVVNTTKTVTTERVTPTGKVTTVVSETTSTREF